MLAAQRSWWSAIASADTGYLTRHSGTTLAVTLSSGRRYDRAELITFAASVSHRITATWAREAIQLLTASVAVAQVQATETDGRRASVYRYLTVFERSGSEWKVIAAQSTREPVFTARVSMALAGPLDDYAGNYQTPRGLALRVSVRDSILVMVEPSGLELRYHPVGLGVFESDNVSPDGAITRIGFARDATGRVAAMSVLSPGVVHIFPRTP